MLGYVFALFSHDLRIQLIALSPIIIVGAVLVVLGILRLRRQLKSWRYLVGHSIMAALAGYAVFDIMILLLGITGTSFGSPATVIVVFAGLYWILLGAVFCGLSLLFSLQRLKRHWRKLARLQYFLHVALLGLLFYAFYIEPFWIDVTYTNVHSSKIAAGTPPLKIALISDIHMERWTRREDDALAKFAAINPDLILISGDHINTDYIGNADSYNDLKRFLNGLHAKYGVFAVGGVVDNMQKTRQVFAETGVRLLDNEVVALTINGQAIELVGVKSSWDDDTEVVQNTAQGLSPNTYKIFLYHTPNLPDEAAALGFDLYLAGHTHGGQIAMPFFGALSTGSLHGLKYKAGLYNVGRTAPTYLYITRGLGFEGFGMPRARLFARPEISVINLMPK